MHLGRILKITAIGLVVYVAIVVAFESLLGWVQPTPGSTIRITTFDADGTPHDRVVTSLASNDKLYVAANHWPRAWYRRALENPNMQVTTDGQTRDYRAIPVTGAEHERVDADNRLPLPFRIVTGFPPRYFVRLEPR
jgi:hypothetical protein